MRQILELDRISINCIRMARRTVSEAIGLRERMIVQGKAGVDFADSNSSFQPKLH